MWVRVARNSAISLQNSTCRKPRRVLRRRPLPAVTGSAHTHQRPADNAGAMAESALPTSYPTMHEWSLTGNELHTTLCACYSERLCLPLDTKFTRLRALPKSVPLLPGSPFAVHDSFALPCDHGTRASLTYPNAFTPGFMDTVHCFILRPDLALELNSSLTEWALYKECLADAALAEWSAQDSHAELEGNAWVSAWLSEGPQTYDAGVRHSNVGGYQSHADVFDAGQMVADEERLPDSSWGCRQLHRVCSAAMHELGPLMYPDADSSLPDPHGAGDPAVRHRGGEPHKACAWANVNRGHSFNTMHIHEVGRWSAVYFVADGEGGAADGSAGDCDPPGGDGEAGGAESGQPNFERHLIFRGGAQPEAGSDASMEAASHSFMAVPPTPGSLWLFPGSVPHCVLGSADADGGVSLSPLDRSAEFLDVGADKPDAAARISVAINYMEAKVPPPVAMA